MKRFNKGDKEKITHNFHSSEFDCKCDNPECKVTFVGKKLVDELQWLRYKMAMPLRISSGFRCQKHNSETKGSSEASWHMAGHAVDIIKPEGMLFEVFHLAVSRFNWDEIIVNKEKGYIHVVKF